MIKHVRPTRVAGLLAAGLALAVGLVVAPGEPAPARAAEVPRLDVADIGAHLKELQAIADASGGNRAAGSGGYAKSVDYVAGKLDAAGFTVERQKCETCTGSGDESVIADWPGGDENSTIMFGAHLDSVAEGPGINDNGSGSATLLQLAQTLAKTKPEMTKHVRFAWWADEEQEDDASTYYVENTGTSGLEAYLNFDMLASPNAGYFLSFPDKPYAKAISSYLDTVGIEADEWPADCDCSDDAAFTDAGVPTTYFNTGDEDEMTDEQAAKWGGEAGEVFDACYHSQCDAYPDNINNTALEHTANATAHALWTLAVK